MGPTLPNTRLREPKPNPGSVRRLILAPMEGVVDAIMRDMLTRIGGYDRCVTEFVRVSQTVLPSRVFYRLCPELRTNGHTAAGVPVYVQLLGSNPSLMADNARVAARLGAPGIDLNFGCPTKTVNKSDGGAALLRTPERIAAVCAAVRQAVPLDLPVTAKVRLGFDDPSEFSAIFDAASSSGISELIVHARTRTQGYKPPAHWSHLRDAVRRSSIPIIANGELWSAGDIELCQQASGCEDFMLARGALCRPDLARAIRAADAGNDSYESMGWSDVAPLLSRFLERNACDYEPRYAVNPLKQWLVYLKHYFPQAGALFAQVKRITDYHEMKQALVSANPNQTPEVDCAA